MNAHEEVLDNRQVAVKFDEAVEGGREHGNSIKQRYKYDGRAIAITKGPSNYTLEVFPPAGASASEQFLFVTIQHISEEKEKKASIYDNLNMSQRKCDIIRD